jgi:hypothetical protein
MSPRFTATEKSRPLWQVLLAPMLLASLGLHGLVLMLPTGANNVVIPPPDPEQDSVAITRVPPAGTPETQTETADPEPVAAGAAAIASPGALPSAGAASQVAGRPPAARPAATPATLTTPPDPVAAPPSPPPTAPPPAPPTPPSTAPATSQPLFEGEIGDRLRTYVAGLNLPADRVEQLRAAILQRVTYTAEATTAAAFDQNLSQWQQAIRTETGLSDLTPTPAPEALAVTYYQRACLTVPPGPVQAGVLVSPSGSTRSQPVVLRSSGYGAVDDHALRAVASHQFPRASQARAYTITVETDLAGQSDCLTVDNVAQEASATGT